MSARHAVRPSWWVDAAPWLLGVLTIGGVWVTVGPLAAAVVAGLLVIHRLLLPGRRVLATAALIGFVLIPVVWFVGSGLPLSPPAPRIQDNVLAHQVGGLAVWFLFIAVMDETRASRQQRPDDVARPDDDHGVVENAA